MTTQPMITLVNHFTLNEQADSTVFEAEFAKVGEHFAKQDGILGYTLSRDLNNPRAYVNVALWTDSQSLQTAIRAEGFIRLVARLRTLSTSDGRTFEKRLQHVSETIHAY